MGLISEAQLTKALEQQGRTGGLLGHILLEQGTLNETQLAELLAEQAELPFVAKLEGTQVSEKLASSLLRVDALQYRAVPFSEEDGVLVVALADPRKGTEVAGNYPAPGQVRRRARKSGAKADRTALRRRQGAVWVKPLMASNKAPPRATPRGAG